MKARDPRPNPRQVRAWLEYVVEAALELLDAMDGDPEAEDEEREDDREAA